MTGYADRNDGREDLVIAVWASNDCFYSWTEQKWHPLSCLCPKCESGTNRPIKVESRATVVGEAEWRNWNSLFLFGIRLHLLLLFRLRQQCEGSINRLILIVTWNCETSNGYGWAKWWNWAHMNDRWNWYIIGENWHIIRERHGKNSFCLARLINHKSMTKCLWEVQHSTWLKNQASLFWSEEMCDWCCGQRSVAVEGVRRAPGASARVPTTVHSCCCAN